MFHLYKQEDAWSSEEHHRAAEGHGKEVVWQDGHVYIYTHTYQSSNQDLFIYLFIYCSEPPNIFLI